LVVVLGALFAGAFWPAASAPRAFAGHEDGHLITNGLLKRLIEGVDGERSPPRLCGPAFPASTQAAAQSWRNTVGTGGGNVVDIFSYQASCSGADVVVTTSSYPPQCADFDGCTPLIEGTDYSLVTPIYVYLNPSVFHTAPNYSGDPYADGGSHTTRDIAHELGHALGHDDYDGCPYGVPTLMDTNEGCWYTTPQALDETNYHYAYHADPVSSFSASPDGEHRVRFTWNASNLHNEREFLITWRNQCGGQWQNLGLTNSPAGVW
jgi:hypothetical protein